MRKNGGIMEKENVLEIEFLKVWDKWAWRITKNEGYKEADECIAVNIEKRTLYHFNLFYNCWDEIKENSLISTKLKEDIEKIIELINKKHGKIKRWRAQAGNLFCYITSDGDIESDYEDLSDENMDMYNLGNYFKTEEEAQKVIDSKEWQEFWEKVRNGEIGGDNGNKSK